MSDENPYWKGKSYSFLQNTACEFFPCHKCGNPKKFNCLFCFCPLYVLGNKCGGNPKYLEDGTKDCSECLLPHIPENYGYVIEKFSLIKDEMKTLREALNER